jgi:site-specific DNA-methyltransferase (adenine-specific)
VFGNGRILYNPQGLSTDVARVIERRGNWQRTIEAKRRLGHIKIAQEYTQQYTNYPKMLIRFPKGRDDITHETQKPVALLKYLIHTYTNEGDAVLDFTMGSGTTGVACMQTGRRFIGIERDASYFAIAQERIERAAMQLRLAV